MSRPTERSNALYRSVKRCVLVPTRPLSAAIRGTSLRRNCLLLGHYGRSMPRALRKSKGGERSYALYRGTSLIRRRTPFRPYRRLIPRALPCSYLGPYGGPT